MGKDSGSGIETPYGLQSSGFELRWGTNFLPPSRRTLGSKEPAVQWVRGIFQLFSGLGVASTTHPRLRTRLEKQYSYKSTPRLCLHGLLQSGIYFLTFNHLILIFVQHKHTFPFAVPHIYFLYSTEVLKFFIFAQFHFLSHNFTLLTLPLAGTQISDL